MSTRLEGIHFLVTYRCTYACEHCFVWGSPDAEATMTLAQLTGVIASSPWLRLAFAPPAWKERLLTLEGVRVADGRVAP